MTIIINKFTHLKPRYSLVHAKAKDSHIYKDDAARENVFTKKEDKKRGYLCSD